MKKDEIYKHLVACSNGITEFALSSMEMFTTASIEKNFLMKTNIANHHLNQLFKEGKLIKINTKPVYYLPPVLIEKINEAHPSRSTYKSIEELEGDKPSNILELIIGNSGSLNECIRQCKVAVNYPGNGLPLLLSGPTGTGKTFLAKCLYKYAVQENILSQNAPFSIFNCAEYANNPELIGSKLFGHVKGAFTGADRDVAGIIENANNGVLLIDEVHRLSPENQEKLFLFMDDGVFRRIGENSVARKASVRLIFATTEDLDTSLLKTFLRRIPIVVKVPPVDKRGTIEKQAFIYHFFQLQSKKMLKEIHVELPVITYLTSMSLEGNVGGLENAIKYTCANAYLESKKLDYILIKTKHLPMSSKNNIPVDFSEVKQEIIRINGSNIKNNPILTEKVSHYIKLTQEIKRLFKEVSSGAIKMSQYREEAFRCVDEFLEEHQLNNGLNERDHFIAETSKNALNMIKSQYNIELDSNCIRIIADYTSEIPVNIIQEQTREKVDKNLLNNIFSYNYERCNSFIRVMKQLNVNYPINYADADELIITSILDYYSNQKIITGVKAIIVCHGYSTASSLASTANRLIGENIYKAFDMPPEVSSIEIGKKLKDYLKYIDTRDGVIILIDIGNIENLYKGVSKVIEGDMGIIDNVSTKLAIDVGQKILNEEPLLKIVEESAKRNITNSKILRNQRRKDKAIVVTCQTGIGTAFKIKQLIEQCLTETMSLEVIVSEYSRLVRDKEDMSIFSRYDVIGIIGTADPNVSQVPFVGIEDMMDEHGAERLQSLFNGHLTNDEIQELNNKLMKSLSKENIVNLLTILNPDKTLIFIEEMIHQWEMDFNMILPNNLVIGLYVHLSSMIERVITHNEMSFHENQKKYEKEHKYFFQAMQKGFEGIQKNYHTEVPNSEIAYIYDIFKLKIPHFQF